METFWLLHRIGVECSKPLIKLREGLNKVGRNIESKTRVNLPSQWVSRYHCDITVNQGYIFIKDLGSCNGTYVNSIRLDKERLTELKSGDFISLGRNYQKEDEPLDKNHYVFKVVSCDTLNGQNEMENFGATKRKSSTSPDADPYNNNTSKRAREASPVTSHQITSSVKLPTPFVDLTIDDPLPPPSPPKENIPVKNNISNQEITSYTLIDLTDSDPKSPAPLVEDTPLANSNSLKNDRDNNIFSNKKLDVVLEVLKILPPDQLEVVRGALKLHPIMHKNNGVIQDETWFSHSKTISLETNSDNIFKKPSTPNDTTASNTLFKSLNSSLCSSIQEPVCRSSNITSTCGMNNEISSSNDDVLPHYEEQNVPESMSISSGLKINSIVSLNEISFHTETLTNEIIENASSIDSSNKPSQNEQSDKINHDSTTNPTNMVRLDSKSFESEISYNEINIKKKRRLGGNLNDLKLNSIDSENVQMNLPSSCLELNNSLRNVENYLGDNEETLNIKTSVRNSEGVKPLTQKEQKSRRKSSDSEKPGMHSRRKSLDERTSSMKFSSDKSQGTCKSVDKDNKVGGTRQKSIEKKLKICSEKLISIEENENTKIKNNSNNKLKAVNSVNLKLNATTENNQNNLKKDRLNLCLDPQLEKLLNDLDSGSSSMSEYSLDHHFRSKIRSSSNVKHDSKVLEMPENDNSYNLVDIETHLQSFVNKSEKLKPKLNTDRNIGIKDLPKSTSVDDCEVIDLDNDDMDNLSFSQEGVVEVDEGDTTYSSLFLDDFDIIDSNDKTDDKVDGKPLLVCSRMIKEEVEEIHEEADIDLFESHFSQCSQEIDDIAYGPETCLEIKTQEEPLEKIPVVTTEKKPPSLTNCDVVNVGSTTDLKVIPSDQPLKITISRSSVSSNEDSNSGSSPRLTGAKLVKSTLLSKPLTVNKVNKRGRKKQSQVEPSVTRDSIARRTKEKISEERKIKLRDLALQRKTALENQNNAHSINKDDNKETAANSVKIAKITERNRSSILLEGLLEMPKPRRSNRKPSKAFETELVDSSKSKEIKSCLKNSNCRISKNRVSFSEHVDIKLFECDGKMNKLSASSSKDKIPSRSQTVNIHRNLEIQANEFIFNVVHWNTSWVNESKKVKGDPPICKDVYRGKDTYVSFSDYHRWLSPIIMYELWANVIKSMDERTENRSMLRFDGVILHKEPKRSDKRLLTLKCCVPLLAKAIPTLVDPMDNILVSTCASSDGRKMLLMFGIVDSQVRVTSVRGTSDPIVRNYLANLPTRCDVCAYFDIVVHNSPNKSIEPGYNLKIRPTYNMMTEMRQYECLNRLQTSPLLWKIVDPEKDCHIQLPKNLEDTKLVSNLPLNKEQTTAVLGASHLALSKNPGISIVHGPPGTGKTRVISAITEQIVHYNKKKGNGSIILICTHSNSAIDAICQRLLDVRKQLPREKRFRLTRFGRKERVHPRVVDILTTTLARNEIEKINADETFALEMEILKARERMFASSLETSNIEELRKYKRMYEVVQENISQLEPILKKTASEEARKKEIDRLVAEEELKIINRTDIIATTLGSCTSRRLLKALNDPSVQKDSEKRGIGVCIIDEAAQATEADTLLPLIHGVSKIILVGDQQQLPPFVISETGKRNGLSCSLFARLHKVWSTVKPLDGVISVPLFPLKIQHRMHPDIASFPSSAFYDNQLQTPEALNLNKGYKPYAVFTHQYFQDPESESNQKEGELLLEILDVIVGNQLYKSLSIGIIVPYQRQKAIIFEMVKARKYHRLVDVNTIDSYQGQERDVIILSTVRTQGVGFLSDYQRTNVAITRAKKALYILGNFLSLQGEPTWKNLLSDAQKRGLHFDLPSNFNSSEIIDFLSNDKKRKRPTK